VLFRSSAGIVALVTTFAAPGTTWAFGFPGCPNLPEYARAVGTLQGLSTCGLNVEEARRVVAAHDGTAVAPQEAARGRQIHHPQHRRLAKHRAAHRRGHAAR
jgi:hypothetical protein